MIMKQKKDVVGRYHYVIISHIFAISDFLQPQRGIKDVYAEVEKNIGAKVMTWENCLITS